MRIAHMLWLHLTDVGKINDSAVPFCVSNNCHEKIAIHTWTSELRPDRDHKLFATVECSLVWAQEYYYHVTQHTSNASLNTESEGFSAPHVTGADVRSWSLRERSHDERCDAPREWRASYDQWNTRWRTNFGNRTQRRSTPDVRRCFL